MTIHKPRSRMISIRLWEEEYQALRHLCSANGTQSLSDFAREAMQAHLNDASTESHGENARCNCMNEFEVRLSRLDQKMDELFKMVLSFTAEQKN